MTGHLQFTGAVLIALAFAHLAFPRYFGWRQELARVSLLTRQIFYVHTFFICLVLVLIGLLCFTLANELLRSTPVNRAIHLGLAVFWLARLYTQFFVYDRVHWLGKRLETAIHVLFTLLWTYLAGLHAYIFTQLDFAQLISGRTAA